MVRNFANMLTIMRILLIPVIIWLFFLDKPFGFITASVLFAIACVTDYFDGLIARATRVSNFGAFLDPLADKLLVSSTLIMLAGFDRVSGVSLIPCVAIVCREILISGLREFLGKQGITVPVSRIAKWKTAIQMFSIGFLIAGNTITNLPLYDIGVIGIWLAAVLTVISAYGYFYHSYKLISNNI